MPAAANILALAPAPGSIRGLIVPLELPAWPAKDPSETVCYGVDFAAVLPPDVPIVQLDYAVDPAGAASVLRGAWSGTLVTLQIAGGAAGTPATLAIAVTLLSGDQVTRAISLPILLQAALSPPAAGALTVNGYTLAVAGQPLLIDPGT